MLGAKLLAIPERRHCTLAYGFSRSVLTNSVECMLASEFCSFILVFLHFVASRWRLKIEIAIVQPSTQVETSKNQLYPI